MGLGGRAPLQPIVPTELEGKNDVVEGILHVGLHQGYRNMTNPKFLAVDEILRAQVEATVGDPEAFDTYSGAESRTSPEATLRKALSRNMSWEDIERAFVLSRFWQRDGDPKTETSSFEAHDTNSTVLRLTNFWRSRQEILCRQVEEAPKFVPKAKSWFDAFIDDPDISDYLELDMGRVWSEVASVNGSVVGPDGRPIELRIERDQFGMIEKSFLDIGIVRLPDIEQPYVKVFRVKLTVWSQVSKKLTLRTGIRGELRSCKYGPRDEHKGAIKEALRQVKTGGKWKIEAKGDIDALRVRDPFAGSDR